MRADSRVKSTRVKERRRCSQGVKYRFAQGRANKGPPSISVLAAAAITRAGCCWRLEREGEA